MTTISIKKIFYLFKFLQTLNGLNIVQDTCSNWTGYDIKIELNKNYMQNKKKLEAFGWHVYIGKQNENWSTIELNQEC